MDQGAREIRVVAVIQHAVAMPTVVAMLKLVASSCFVERRSTSLEKAFLVGFSPVVAAVAAAAEGYLPDVVETVTMKASFLLH